MTTMPSSGPPLGAHFDQKEELNGTPIDSDLLLSFVQLCLNRLEGDERDKFVGALHSLLSQGVDQVLAPAKTNGTNGKSRTNGDRGARSGNRSTTGDRRPAMDATVRSINLRSFLQRFPEANKVSIW
jgi:hypothetical protein